MITCNESNSAIFRYLEKQPSWTVGKRADFTVKLLTKHEAVTSEFFIKKNI